MKKMKKIMLSMALLASLWTGSSINNRAEAGLMCMPFSYAGGFVVVISSFSYGLLTIGLTSADFIEEDHIMNRVGGIIFFGGIFLGEEDTADEGISNLLIQIAKNKHDLDLDEDTARELSLISVITEHQDKNSNKVLWISASESSIENVLEFTDYNDEEQSAIIEILTATIR
ncbi:MAG: hypothetical protein KAQ98_10175 [Bacteriovoracaceae bacterium]|nr:hypothetical protein [Bacteriovoracaceae bacterium]